VLSGEKQRIERNYNFVEVASWFAARCDLILLLFDPAKLDISDEFKSVRLTNALLQLSWARWVVVVQR
jgi:EH domain-containing protein 1